MSLVVATEPTSLVAVEDQCARIEAWAETCDNVAELRDVMNKCSAISEYLRLTATEGTARVETAKRRLEVRIGQLIGPPTVGAHSSASEGADLAPNQRSSFRAMAADPETVEAVIAGSTDAAPPSRKKVMDAIKAKRKPTEEDVLKKLSRAAVAARVEKAKQMAAEGYTSRQIADAIEVTPGSFPEFRKRHGIDVPADAIVGKTRLLDADRMVAETVHTLEGAAMTVGLIGDPREAGLNPARIEDWATSLRSSLTVLTQFSKQLKETAQ